MKRVSHHEKHMTLRLGQKLHKKLLAESLKRDTNISEEIRRILKKYFKIN